MIVPSDFSSAESVTRIMERMNQGAAQAAAELFGEVADLLQSVRTLQARAVITHNWIRRTLLWVQTSHTLKHAKKRAEYARQLVHGYRNMTAAELLIYQRLERHLRTWSAARCCIKVGLTRNDLARSDYLMLLTGLADCFLRLDNIDEGRSLLEETVLPEAAALSPIEQMEVYLVAVHFYISLDKKYHAIRELCRAKKIADLLGGDYLDWVRAFGPRLDKLD